MKRELLFFSLAMIPFAATGAHGHIDQPIATTPDMRAEARLIETANRRWLNCVDRAANRLARDAARSGRDTPSAETAFAECARHEATLRAELTRLPAAAAAFGPIEYRKELMSSLLQARISFVHQNYRDE